MKTITLLFIMFPLFFLMAQKQVLIDGGKAGDFYYKGNAKSGNLGIGSKNPAQKLEVDGSINLGINRSDDKTRTNSQGNKLYFLGAHYNSDPLWMGRYNIKHNISELRVNIGDDPNADQPLDKFVVGTTAPKGKDGKWAPKFTVRSDGNVGIGANDPKQKLEVDGSINLGINRSDDATRTNFQGNKLYFLGANNNSDPLWMGRYNIESDISELRVNIGDNPNADQPLDKFVVGTTSDGKWESKFTVRSDGNVSVLGDLKMSGKDSYIWTNGTGTGYTGIWDQKNKRVLLYTTEATGNVGIGTKTPDMKLTVNGKVHAKGMRIDTTITADYVFEKFYTGTSKLNPNYKMPTLKEVEAFTKKHHHLPEIPSVKEVRKQGLIVEDMTILMLQKIEELTLYTIQQEKRITNLEAKNNKLQNENNALKTIYKRLDKLEQAQGVRKN